MKSRALRLAAAVLALALLLSACGAAPAEPEHTAVPEAAAADPTEAPSVKAEPEPWRTEELSLTRDGLHIAGRLLLPTGEGPFPIAILCHGYGGTMQYMQPYAEFLAENGVAACVFDFIGGGVGIRSDGTMLDMTVLTEAADLETVMDALLERSELDGDKLFLIGASQGGFIVTYVAGQRPAEVRGLLPLYPGYGLQDGMKRLLDEDGSAPETVTLLGHTISRAYVEDALSFDIADCMRAYDGPVRILHGTRDTVAPILYSNLALREFPNAEVVSIQGAGHGFQGEDDRTARDSMLDFIRSNCA